MQNGVWMFLSFIQSIIGFSLMSSSVMRFREPVKKRIMTGLIVMVCILSLTLFALLVFGIPAVEGYSIVIILAVVLAWFLICSGDPFFVSCFNLLTYVNIYVSISFTSDLLSMHARGVQFVIMHIIVRGLIYVVIVPLLFKFVRPRFRRLVHALDKEWRAATLVPLLFLVLQTFLLYYPGPYWNWEKGSWSKYIIFAVYALFLAVYYLLYIQASAIVEKYSLENRQLLMAQQNKLWESELARQKAAMALTSQQRHDMHHHNAVILGMLQTGDAESLKAYMRGLDAALDAHNANSFCTNPIANSIFNVYASRAAAAGIKTTFRVSVPENIGIDNIDLTCVLGNALENALEGCVRLPSGDRELIVTAKFMDGRLRLQVENTCRDDIIFDGELPVSQKQSGGTGTKSILYTAECYDGTAGFAVRDGKFITQIVLNGR